MFCTFWRRYELSHYIHIHFYVTYFRCLENKFEVSALTVCCSAQVCLLLTFLLDILTLQDWIDTLSWNVGLIRCPETSDWYAVLKRWIDTLSRNVGLIRCPETSDWYLSWNVGLIRCPETSDWYAVLKRRTDTLSWNVGLIRCPETSDWYDVPKRRIDTLSWNVGLIRRPETSVRFQPMLRESPKQWIFQVRRSASLKSRTQTIFLREPVGEIWVVAQGHRPLEMLSSGLQTRRLTNIPLITSLIKMAGTSNNHSTFPNITHINNNVVS